MKKFYEIYTKDAIFTDRQGNPVFLLGTFNNLAIADSWRRDEYWHLDTYIKEVIIDEYDVSSYKLDIWIWKTKLYFCRRI